MTENLTVYEQAPTTDRPAELLAKKHGFESLAQLAESLPEGANVLDVGSGASPFGREVAALRPDITWTNFDYSYNEPSILSEVSADAPSNVEYVAGDATKLAEIYQSEEFDAVFSYWLFPHLSIEDTAPAKAAAKAIFAITKTNGLMSVGPKNTKGKLPAIKSGKAIGIIKSESIDTDAFADEVVNATKLTRGTRFSQKLSNEVTIPYFGTSRFVKRGTVPGVYSPRTQEFVSPFSREGVHTALGLTMSAAKHIKDQRKKRKS